MPNMINRDFHAKKPDGKWLTDITEFATPAGKVYLSPIVGCFDGMLPYWTASTAPDAGLVNGMLDGATSQLGGGGASRRPFWQGMPLPLAWLDKPHGEGWIGAFHVQKGMPP